MSLLQNIASLPPISVAEDTLTPRIIQYKGKRVCIRLEDIYWDVFEKEAQSKSCKLNKLIHSYYNDPRGVDNHTAFLRRQAVEWLSVQVRNANEKLYLRNSELKSVLRATIQPAIVFSEQQSVSRYNRAFRGWLVENTSEAKSAIDYDAMRITFRRSYNCLLENITEGRGTSLDEQVSVLLPGFVLATRMNVVKIHKHLDQEQLFLGILNNY